MESMETNKYIINKTLSFSMNPKETRLNNNFALIGSPGSGKTHLNSYNIKNMLDRSHVLIDVKGSMSGFLDYFKEHGYKTYHFNLIDVKDSDCYSPLSYVRQDYESIDILSIANAIFGPIQSYDPFWDESATLLLELALTYLYEAFDENKRDFSKLDKIINLYQYEDFREDKKIIDVCLDVLKKSGRNRNFDKLHNRINVESEKTRSCIVQSLYTRIHKCLNPEVYQLLSINEINFQDFLNQKVCLVISINDADTSLHNIAGLMVTQLIQFLIRETPLGGALDIPVQFNLDDCGSYYIRDFDAILSTARSRGIGFTCLFQSQAQLKKMYGESYETIMQCFDTIIFFGGNDRETVNLIKERSEFTSDYIHTLPIGECFVLRRAMPTDLVPILDLSNWKVPEHHLIQRNHKIVQENNQSYKNVDVSHLYEKLKNGTPCVMGHLRRYKENGKEFQLSLHQIWYLKEMLLLYKSETDLLLDERMYLETSINNLLKVEKNYELYPLEAYRMEIADVKLFDDCVDVIRKCLYEKISKGEQRAPSLLDDDVGHVFP